MKSKSPESDVNAEGERRRQHVLFGEGTPLEPDDEPVDSVASRLVRPHVASPSAHAIQDSSFIRKFVQRFSPDLRRMAESKVIEAEVVECRQGSPAVLDLSTGAGILDPSEPVPAGIRPGMRLLVAPTDGPAGPVHSARGMAAATPSRTVYSVRLASGRHALSLIESIWAGRLSIEGVPVERVPQEGWVVDIQGFKAALPEDEVGDIPIQQGGATRFAILHYDPARFCVILSRKQFVLSSRLIERRLAVRKIFPGDILSGRVTEILPTCARLDLGGIRADLSGEDAGFGPARDNLSAIRVGQTIRVFVLDVTLDKISVGTRQLLPDPWVFIKKTLQPGTKIEGVVSAILADRVKVELKEGICGEIPWKDAGWQIEDPAELASCFRIGDTVEAICLSIQRESGKLSLSVKNLKPDPLPEIHKIHPAGSRCKVNVISAGDRRARVVTEDGYYGVILPEDLSWSGPASPADFFGRVSASASGVGRAPSAGVSDTGRADRRILVECLSIDPATRLIRFGLKQVNPDPFLLLVRDIEVGKSYEGRVVKNISVGALVEIRKGLVGLLRKSDCVADEPAPVEGQTLAVMVMNIQPQHRRITLSRRAMVEIQERKDMQQFLTSAPDERKVRMKDLLQSDAFKRFFESRGQGK